MNDFHPIESRRVFIKEILFRAAIRTQTPLILVANRFFNFPASQYISIIIGGHQEVNLPLAKMFIDQLAVIRAKTRGNLNRDEQRVIDGALSQLEAAFVEVAGSLGDGPAGMPPGMISGNPVAAPAPMPAPEAAPAPPAAPPVPPEEGRKKFTKSYGA